MKKIRVLLIGAAGRMGKTIVDLASRESNIEIVAQCDLGDAIEPAARHRDDWTLARAARGNRKGGTIGADRFRIEFQHRRERAFCFDTQRRENPARRV